AGDELPERLHALTAGWDVGDREVVDEPVGEDLVDNGEVASVLELLGEAAHQFFVGHGELLVHGKSCERSGPAKDQLTGRTSAMPVREPQTWAASSRVRSWWHLLARPRWP